MWSLLAECALRLLAPMRCTSCDELLARESVFCAPCAATVLPPAIAVAGGDSAAAYGGAVAAAIIRFKYAGRTDLARPLAHLMLPFARDIDVDVVVPVPLHAERLRDRGFNQAALLARPVAERLRCPFQPLLLRRVAATAPQASLTREERAANVARAFSVRQPRAVAGKRVLLVDDVRTTGATLAACTGALGRSGAVSVNFLTVAQT